MRWKSVIVLLAIALGTVLPPSLPLMAAQGADISIGTLDVCHGAAPALFTAGDTPCVHECPCNPVPPSSLGTPAIAAPSFKPFLIAYQDERPPQS